MMALSGRVSSSPLRSNTFKDDKSLEILIFFQGKIAIVFIFCFLSRDVEYKAGSGNG